MKGIMIDKKIFKSKILAYLLIYSFFLLITSEAAPNNVNFDTNKEFKPVVRVKEAQEEISASQKDRFERLIEEGKKLFQEEMDSEGAIRKFKEAQYFAITKAQKADVFFYLSLAYYTTLGEGAEELAEAIRSLIEIDYYRELDKLLCPPRYIELFQEIKKEYGVLLVQSKPAGADVYLNDNVVSAGKTPLTIGCKAGSVKIRVMKGKKEKTEILRVVAAEKTASSIFVLKGGSSLLLVLGGLALAGGAAVALLGGKKGKPAPATGSIQVNSTPTGAHVYLDGNDTGRTTDTTLTDVSPGSHTVKLVKEGYEDYQSVISITAGQTTTVNTNLTKHTLTVNSPTSSTYWITGQDVEIRWGTNGSANFNVHAGPGTGLNPSYPGRNLSPSFQRRAFRHNSAFRGLLRTKRGLESSNLSKNEGTILNTSSKSQDVQKKSSSHGKVHNIINPRAKNIGIREKNRSFSNDNLHLSRGNSLISSRHLPQALKPSGNIKALTLTDVKIELYKGTSLVQTIAPSTTNDGSYMWTVALSLADGTNYKVRVSCEGARDVYDESETFHIIKSGDYEFVTKWGSLGTGDGEFNFPIGVEVDNLGYVYVTDDYNDRIQKFTSSGDFVAEWGIYGTGDGQFSGPWGIAVDNYGNVYVADSQNDRIQKFNSTRTFLGWWGLDDLNNTGWHGPSSGRTGVSGSGPGQFNSPHGITIDSSGYVYVCDAGNDRIQKFTSNGVFETEWGGVGTGNGQFDWPTGVEVDNSGYVYVVDMDNDRVQKFTSSGSFVTKWGSLGDEDGEFFSPARIAVDSSGYVYVSDNWNDRIQKFTSNGTFVTKWGSLGSGDGQFESPWGIAVDSSDYVYVVDQYNHRLQKFQFVPTTLRVTRKSFKSLDNKLGTNDNSRQKSYNIKSPLQNRLKSQKNQMNRYTRKNEKRIKRKDIKNGKK